MPHTTQTARDILRNPRPDHTPALRLIAWAALKSARGQTLNQSRLQMMARATGSAA